MTVCPARRRSRGSPMTCQRENALTSSSADWRRKCGRKSPSYPKASHSMKFAKLFTSSRTPPQSPRRTPHSRRRQPATAQARASTLSAPEEGAEEEEEVDAAAAEDEEEETPARRAPPGAANQQTGQIGSTSETSHWTSAPSVQRRDTWPSTAEFPQTGKSGTSS